ncbi:MAG: PQQ-binding-like beta-propeller repeat protein, partial [Planctomycetales bacterium]
GETGDIRWITQGGKSTLEGLSDPSRLKWDRGTHLVYQQGTLFGIRADKSGVIAWDAETGMVRWERSLGGIAQDVLGCQGGKLFVSGTRLWGVDIETGRIIWQIGSRDVELQSFGRGLLSETQILWPTREELLCIDQETGTLHRRMPLQAVWNLTGGNLGWGHGILLIAQTQKLTAIPLFRGVKSTRDVEVSLDARGIP